MRSPALHTCVVSGHGSFIWHILIIYTSTYMWYTEYQCSPQKNIIVSNMCLAIIYFDKHRAFAQTDNTVNCYSSFASSVTFKFPFDNTDFSSSVLAYDFSLLLFSSFSINYAHVHLFALNKVTYNTNVCVCCLFLGKRSGQWGDCNVTCLWVDVAASAKRRCVSKEGFLYIAWLISCEYTIQS